ncbi:MAG: Cdc6/Cdc18 family protein [Halobacteriaceae archaeon]
MSEEPEADHDLSADGDGDDAGGRNTSSASDVGSAALAAEALSAEERPERGAGAATDGAGTDGAGGADEDAVEGRDDGPPADVAEDGGEATLTGGADASDAGDALAEADTPDADALDLGEGLEDGIAAFEAGVGLDEADDGDGGLFDELMEGDPIFEDKEVLRPSYTPEQLPHRQSQINRLASILVGALRGETPSNILIYGKTGTGKTASANYVSQELEEASEQYDVPCEVDYINCEITDTQYRVLAQLANKFIERNFAFIEERVPELEALAERAADDPAALGDTGFADVAAVEARIDELEAAREEHETVPMTGWPTDQVYDEFFWAVDFLPRVLVIMLDEIDKLVENSGDDTLYNLSRINSDLENSRVSIIGISNDLKFTEWLDPRVKSSLGEEEIVFPPYDANQLRDILEDRAAISFKEDALAEEVIPLCAAFAAQEHGDARRALDLLRVAGELAERAVADGVEETHVRKAQHKIELDRVVEVVQTLPTQSKFVLASIVILEKEGIDTIRTGDVYNTYKQVCRQVDADTLTQRRITDLISELDMLGVINASVVSKGRYGRSKIINLSVPQSELETILSTDDRIDGLDEFTVDFQSRIGEKIDRIE